MTHLWAFLVAVWVATFGGPQPLPVAVAVSGREPLPAASRAVLPAAEQEHFLAACQRRFRAEFQPSPFCPCWLSTSIAYVPVDEWSRIRSGPSRPGERVMSGWLYETELACRPTFGWQESLRHF